MTRALRLAAFDWVQRARRQIWYARRWNASAEQPSHAKSIFAVDVSGIALNDAGTGIQRVTREFLRALREQLPEGIELVPVVARARHGWCRAALGENGLPSLATIEDRRPLHLGKGDLFLGLDLSAHQVPAHLRQLRDWRANGAKLAFVVYDLLPLLKPQYFTQRMRYLFGRWFRAVVSVADDLLCISDDVAATTSAYLASDGVRSPPRVGRIMLGTELPPVAAPALRPDYLPSDYCLVVGTIEPRKNQALALDAMERLWAGGSDVSLVLAGRRGWHSEALEQRLRNHPERGRRLFWIEGPDDALLHTLYLEARLLLMLSHAEGFGLPVVEARSLGLPVLALDLKVYDEHGDGVDRVPADAGAEDVATAIKSILLRGREKRKSGSVRRWRDGAQQLYLSLMGDIATSRVAHGQLQSRGQE